MYLGDLIRPKIILLYKAFSWNNSGETKPCVGHVDIWVWDCATNNIVTNGIRACTNQKRRINLNPTRGRVEDCDISHWLAKIELWSIYKDQLTLPLYKAFSWGNLGETKRCVGQLDIGSRTVCCNLHVANKADNVVLDGSESLHLSSRMTIYDTTQRTCGRL